jgi:uncharacterized membrane protein
MTKLISAFRDYANASENNGVGKAALNISLSGVKILHQTWTDTLPSTENSQAVRAASRIYKAYCCFYL